MKSLFTAASAFSFLVKGIVIPGTSLGVSDVLMLPVVSVRQKSGAARGEADECSHHQLTAVSLLKSSMIFVVTPSVVRLVPILWMTRLALSPYSRKDTFGMRTGAAAMRVIVGSVRRV